MSKCAFDINWRLVCAWSIQEEMEAYLISILLLCICAVDNSAAQGNVRVIRSLLYTRIILLLYVRIVCCSLFESLEAYYTTVICHVVRIHVGYTMSLIII